MGFSGGTERLELGSSAVDFKSVLLVRLASDLMVLGPDL